MSSAHISRSLSHPPSPGTIHHGIHETCSPILSVEKQLLEMTEESSEHKEPSSKSDIAYIIIKIHFHRDFSSTPFATARVVYVFRKMSAQRRCLGLQASLTNIDHFSSPQTIVQTVGCTPHIALEC